jgi:hypothetical protein
MRYLFPFLVLLAPSSEAADPPKLFCKAVSEIKGTVRDCDDNQAYAVAALDCLEKLEAEIKETQKGMASELRARNKAAAGAQKSLLSTSKENYAASVAKLDLLIGKTESILAEVRAYAPDMAYPEDATAPETTGMDPDEYLKTESCYADNMDTLNFIAGDLLGHLDDLKATRNLASGHQATAGKREAQLDQKDTLNRKLSSKGKASGVPKVSGKSPRRASDITGTEKKKSVLPTNQ